MAHRKKTAKHRRSDSDDNDDDDIIELESTTSSQNTQKSKSTATSSASGPKKKKRKCAADTNTSDVEEPSDAEEVQVDNATSSDAPAILKWKKKYRHLTAERALGTFHILQCRLLLMQPTYSEEQKAGWKTNLYDHFEPAQLDPANANRYIFVCKA